MVTLQTFLERKFLGVQRTYIGVKETKLGVQRTYIGVKETKNEK